MPFPLAILPNAFLQVGSDGLPPSVPFAAKPLPGRVKDAKQGTMPTRAKRLKCALCAFAIQNYAPMVDLKRLRRDYQPKILPDNFGQRRSRWIPRKRLADPFSFSTSLQCCNENSNEMGTKNFSPNNQLPSKNALHFVAKTNESFKLADLYWLESSIMAYCQNFNTNQPSRDSSDLLLKPSCDLVERLAFHRPTASYLLGYQTFFKERASEDVPSRLEPMGYNANGNGVNIGDCHYKASFSSCEVKLPFRPCRFQYVAQVIASGETPQDLIQSIQQTFSCGKPTHNGIIGSKDNATNVDSRWTLDYDTIEPLRHPMHPKRSFTSTMLLCAISRVLPGEPFLNANNDKSGGVISYKVIEISRRLYLVQIMSSVGVTRESAHIGINSKSHSPAYSLVQLMSTKNIAKQFRTLWSKRPFQYSGAINLDVALTVVDILGDLIQTTTSAECKSAETMAESSEIESSRKIRVLDPTCGSGTFLALTLMAWARQSPGICMEVVGVDSNPKCALGTVQNLKSLFSQPNNQQNLSSESDNENESWKLEISPLDTDPNSTSSASATSLVVAADSSAFFSSNSPERFDCAVANLPWNRNTFEFNGLGNENEMGCSTNSAILKSVASVLKPGAPLVVVSGGKQSNNEPNASSFDAAKCLESLGFEVFPEVLIPPNGFNLPDSNKSKSGKMTKINKQQRPRSSDCEIIVAISPSNEWLTKK